MLPQTSVVNRTIIRLVIIMIDVRVNLQVGFGFVLMDIKMPIEVHNRYKLAVTQHSYQKNRCYNFTIHAAIIGAVITLCNMVDEYEARLKGHLQKRLSIILSFFA